jgi:hypothetical protein
VVVDLGQPPNRISFTAKPHASVSTNDLERNFQKNNYYTSTNFARQQLFCNLEDRVGIEPTNICFADNYLTIQSPVHYSGTPSRNWTHIHSLEESCIFHYTIGVWYGWWDSNPQNSDFKSDMYTNSITSASKEPLFYINMFYMSTTIWYPCSDSNWENFSFWERWLYQFV